MSIPEGLRVTAAVFSLVAATLMYISLRRRGREAVLPTSYGDVVNMRARLAVTAVEWLALLFTVASAVSVIASLVWAHYQQ
ncbi:hypothetical protein [Amycolatopsis samaneae]|uniref:Uncharacterized protein n=1 Tax=Amycolatopsis samaneae TaxID=664691 RepID=A0ABW5GI76_9PSEU